MKALVGVDYRNGYRESLDQLEFLQFPKMQLTLLHAMGSRSFGNGVTEPSMEYSGVFHGVLEREAANLLGSAHNQSQGRFHGVTTFLSRRTPIDALSEEAQVTGAELIAVTPTVRANSDRPFGSTTHGILENLSTPVLIARPKAMNRLKVGVVVTDGSEANRAMFSNLLTNPPCGVDELHILELQDEQEVAVGAGLSTSSVATALRSTQLESQLDQLRGLGFASTGSVRSGLNEIAQFAQSKNAGLVIVGSSAGGLSPLAREVASANDFSSLIYA